MVRESDAGHAACIRSTAFSASSRNFDLNGEAKAARKEQSSRCRTVLPETRPEAIELARKPARKPKGNDAPSLRDISAVLARRGHVTMKGMPYGPMAVKLMLR
jgi:hypothetical protein